MKHVHIGYAAELLVCFDFVVRGYDAVINPFPGSAYDVFVDLGKGPPIKIQVKATQGVTIKQSKRLAGERGRPAKGKIRSLKIAVDQRPVYRFGLKGGTQRYEIAGVDVFAFVALDIRKVVYLPATVFSGRAPESKKFGAQAFAKLADTSLDEILAQIMFS